VPRPRNDPSFRWEYTYVEDDGFDDGRTPQAATLICDGVPFPDVVLDVARPLVTEQKSGPWWLGQDPAVGRDSYAQNVLELAVMHGLLPILSRSQIAAASSVEITAVRAIRLPVYDEHEQLGHRLVREVRERVRRLTDDTHRGHGDELLRDLAAALDDLRAAVPGDRNHIARIGLARFPYRPWRQGPRTERVHPVILKDESRRQAPDDDGFLNADAQREHDGDLQHPTERALAQLDDGDATGIRAILGSRDIGAYRAFTMGEMLRARESVRRAPATSPADDGMEVDAEVGDAEPLIEAAWRRADELGSADGAYELASLLHSRGELAEAEAAATRADSRGSASGAALLGSLLDRRGEAGEAEAAFTRADDRGHRTAAFNLGLSLKRRGLGDEAVAAFGRADERGDRRAATLLGLRLQGLGDLEGAAAAFRRADERGDGPGAYLLGRMAHDRGDKVGAEAAWRRADERGEPQSATALGVLYVSRDQLEAAEAAFARGDERGDGAAAFLLGRYLQQRSQEDEARAAYARAADRGIADAAYRLGAQRHAAGDHDGAETAWRRAAELGSVEGSFNLAHELVNKGKLGEALPLLRDATLSRHPDIYPRAAFMFGTLFVRAGRHEEARAALQLAVQSGHAEIAPMAATELAALEKREAEEATGPSLDEALPESRSE